MICGDSIVLSDHSSLFWLVGNHRYVACTRCTLHPGLRELRLLPRNRVSSKTNERTSFDRDLARPGSVEPPPGADTGIETPAKGVPGLNRAHCRLRGGGEGRVKHLSFQKGVKAYVKESFILSSSRDITQLLRH